MLSNTAVNSGEHSVFATSSFNDIFFDGVVPECIALSFTSVSSQSTLI